MNRSSIYVGLWLIGLGVLFLTDLFWPGILILVGLSMLVSVLFPAERENIQAAEAKDRRSQPRSDAAEPIPPALGEDAPLPASAPAHSLDLLPDECPLCGGPVLEQPDRLVWSGVDHAQCPYCRTVLPLPASLTPGNATRDTAA